MDSHVDFIAHDQTVREHAARQSEGRREELDPV
jgi:hypothetical protein